ncbi:hypothetical protein CEXT_737241 [Caerostris extrusa]|uniref:Uncharacterized protein n=1 Tax=Caerostris extrusa TaxID=172846 RepID=A0AAV4WUZ1_CAEEX|nr:hypothetical protein CEXT_737241 [Caerostris extrusa]
MQICNRESSKNRRKRRALTFRLELSFFFCCQTQFNKIMSQSRAHRLHRLGFEVNSFLSVASRKHWVAYETTLQVSRKIKSNNRFHHHQKDIPSHAFNHNSFLKSNM